MEKICEYAKSLFGIKYSQWIEGSTTNKSHPFYVNGPQPLQYMIDNGMCCAGLINLLVHVSGTHEVPGEGEYKGGTYEWFRVMKEKKVMEPFDMNKSYPVGTLLLRNYRDVNDQGHVAMIYSKQKNHPLFDKIIDSSYSLTPEDGCVKVHTLGHSHFMFEDGMYEGVVYPENWIL